MKKALFIVLGLLMVSPAHAAIRITEWMYNGLGAGSIGEFIEITNIGGPAVSLTGWSFDDSSRAPGSQSLSALGTLAPNESAIFTDNTEAAFRSAWSLPVSIKVLGGNLNNLGRADEINIYDASNLLVDRLTYDDQTIIPSIRTNGTSGWPSSPAALGTNNVKAWQLSVVGDAQSSYTSTAGEVGNPGTYIPEPATLICLAAGAVFFRRRR